MQERSSVFSFIWTTLTQIFAYRKRLAAAIAVSVLIGAALVISRAEAGYADASAVNWSAGWHAWKEGDYEKALREWSKDGFWTDFTPRPARNYYWRARALDKLGREKDAAVLKADMARKFPFDYYTFLLFPDGGASAYSAEVYRKMAGMFYPRPWKDEVSTASRKTGISEELIWAVMHRESKFRQHATSSAGAEGLMQLMPLTAKETAARLQICESERDLCQPEQNVLLGASYMKQLIQRFNGELPRAVAAYNAGAANVAKWNMLTARDWIEWVEEIPYAQTREYVRSVLENREVYIIISGGQNHRGLTQITSRPLTPLPLNALLRRQ